MKRNIISINEDLCNGCGACVKGCHEGALQMIDGKARIISELYCDGLGACIGDCPVGAITIEEREAQPYDEIAVMEKISPKGEKTVLAHLNHLKDHGETEYLAQGIDYIKKNNLDIDISKLNKAEEPKLKCGCPGSMAQSFEKPAANAKPQFSMKPAAPAFGAQQQHSQSELTHWPVQLHLINPESNIFSGSDVVLAADCTAYAYPDFHGSMLKGKKLAIACPKLDSNKDVYVEKIIKMIDSSMINTLTVVIMEVPCCGGLIQLAKMAVDRAARKVPLKKIVISVRGEKISEEWI